MTSNPGPWLNQYQLDRARGLKRKVSNEPVRERIEWLIDQGFNCASIARAAGVDPGTVLDARSGENRMITTKTMKKIMDVTPEDIYARSDGRGYVPSVGAVRRIQALMTMGWRYKDLSPRLGFPAEKVGEGAGQIGRHKHEAIVKLYEELWNTRGPASKGYIQKLLNWGWAPPMAWSDEDIDNPDPEVAIRARLSVRRAA